MRSTVSRSMIAHFEDEIARRRTWRSLGYAGLLPQLLAVALVLSGSEYRFVALAGGFAYAAAIFSFLGGVVWGQALKDGRAPGWAFGLAVLPSLIAVLLFLPWTLGWSWPDYSLVIIGVLILVSPLADQFVRLADSDFMRLRWHLSIGLGSLTIVLGVLAFQQV